MVLGEAVSKLETFMTHLWIWDLMYLAAERQSNTVKKRRPEAFSSWKLYSLEKQTYLTKNYDTPNNLLINQITKYFIEQEMPQKN